MSSIFRPRTEAPTETDLNYISTSYGGYNPCLIRTASGSVLPNCVGYTWGRWRELLGEYHNLYTGNAQDAWGYTQDGYQRGQEPKVGAVICYRGGSIGGHTAVVEKIIDDTHILTSNSAYSGPRFFTETVVKQGSSWNRTLASGYTFQGFIYYPKPLVTYNDVGFLKKIIKLNKNSGKKRRC